MNEIITKSITEMLKSPLNSLVSEFGAELKQIVNNRLLEYQTEEYNRNSYVKTLLYRTEPVNLYQIFQPLFLGRETKINGKVEKIPTNTIKEVFIKSKFITIIGYAGSGKSMLMRHLFLDSINSKFKYPIKVELRYLNDYSGSLNEYIKEHIFEFHKLGSNERIISNLLESGKFVFFFDGYDEINSSKKAGITNEINEFVKLYNKNNYIVTSRPFTGIETLPLFHNYWIQAFTDEEVEQFIAKQLKNEKELVEKIITAIKRPENKAYRSFLWNPLLLTMFIISFNTYAEIPQKRSMFYRQVFDTLYLIHDSSSKLAYVREKKSGLDKDKFEKALQAFCFITFFDYKYTFTYDYINDVLWNIKMNKSQLYFENDNIVDDLTIALGFLTKEGFEYTFLHKSLQEYFAALYIANLSKENKKRVYRKLSLKIIGSKLYDTDEYSNLYVLLSEMDNKFLTKDFLLPILEYIVDYLSPQNMEVMLENDELRRVFVNEFWALSMFFKQEKSFEDISNKHLVTWNKLHDLMMSELRGEITENDYQVKVTEIIKGKALPIMLDYRQYVTEKQAEYSKLYQDEEDGDLNILSMLN